MKILKNLWIPLLLAALVFGCPTDSEDYSVKSVEPAAGNPVYVEADAQGAQVTFTGVAGLNLGISDFTVSKGGTISAVKVDGNTVTVIVDFSANEDTAVERTYTVGISPASTAIKGAASVTITQGYAGDTRKLLVAGPAVTVAAGETGASVIFTGATGLTTVGGGQNLEATDFTASSGAVVSSVGVTEDTATVTVSFSANTTAAPKNYTIGVSSSSTLIKGAATVTITQGAREALKNFYVSWSGGNDNNTGLSETDAWKTIAKVNAYEGFQAGDYIRFKSGDAWSWATGDPSLMPQGSGEAGSPIVITSYGAGAKPKFEGNALVDDVIHLHNQQYWEISGLEISNKVAGWTNPTERDDTVGGLIGDKDLRGIFISGNNGETLNGFNLHDLYIHDVTGEIRWIGVGLTGNPSVSQQYPGTYMNAGWDASKRTGAIFVEGQDGTNATIFNNITVEDNVLEQNSFAGFTIKQFIGGSGGKRWGHRANTSYPYTDPNFKPHTNITVRGNYIDQTGWYHGNGIYITSTQGALVENNVIKNPGVCGIELYVADNVVVQHNEIYGSTAKGGGSDSNAIDPDGRTSNIIVQYNYVHDNGDGIMVCAYEFGTAIIRYNVLYNNTGIWFRDSVNAGYVQVYNNILYNTNARSSLTFTNSGGSNNEIWEYKNNVFYNAYSGASVAFATDTPFYYSNNLYYGCTPPAKDTAPVTAAPRFTGIPAFSTGTSADSRFKDFSLLRPGAGSPLINRGVAYSATSNKIDISPDGKDYAGTTLSGAADIGLYIADFNGLAGVVVNDLNEKIPNAAITLTPQTGTNLTATSDTDGGYLFANVPNGAYTLSVIAANHVDSQTSLTVNGDTPSWQVLSAGALGSVEPRTITGTIMEGASPLSGVTVVISKDGTDIATAASIANGSFTLTNVPYGTYTITASKTGYVSQTIENFQVPAIAAIEPVNFVLISSTHVYYNEDFNTLNGWAISDPSNIHTIEIIDDPDNAGNKLLHITKSDSAAGGIYNSTNAGAYGIFTVETRMKRSVSTSAYAQYQLYTYQADKFTGSGSANPSANIVFDTGYIKTHFSTGSSGTTNIQAYTANTWYKITLRIDTATNTFDFYLDEVKKGSGSLRTAVNTIDIFNIASGSTGSGFGDFWVDYIKVYQGEPQFSSGE